MDRNNAIKYLKGKNRIKGEENFSEDEEKEIEKVEKQGKIYGDPVVELK